VGPFGNISVNGLDNTPDSSLSTIGADHPTRGGEHVVPRIDEPDLLVGRLDGMDRSAEARACLDSAAAQDLRQHSHQASPSFALGKGGPERSRCLCAAGNPAGGAVLAASRPWRADPDALDVHGVIGAVSVDAAGFPTARDTGRGSGSCIAFSGADVTVPTSQRLVGLALQGESVLGDVDGRGSRVLVLSAPLADVSVVTLQRQARGKERGLMIGTAAEGDLFVDLDCVVDQRNRARRQQKSDGMQTILTAIAEAWGAGVFGQKPDLLQRGLDGSWLADGADGRRCSAARDVPILRRPGAARQALLRQGRRVACGVAGRRRRHCVPGLILSWISYAKATREGAPASYASPG